MAEIWSIDNSRDAEQQELLFIVGGNAKWYNHLTVGWFLITLNILLQCNPAVQLLSIYPEESTQKSL